MLEKRSIEEVVLTQDKIERPAAEAEEKGEESINESESLTLETAEARAVWEDVTGRSERRKVYTRDGRRKEAVFYANPVHVLEADGSYVEETGALEAEADGTHYKSVHGGLSARFNGEESSSKLFSVEKDGCGLTISVLERGRKRSSMPTPKHRRGEGTGDRLVYENMASATDFVYSVKSDRVKEDIVIRQKAHGYRYEFLLDSTGLAMEFNEEERTLTFKSTESGKEVFLIPAPFMTDGAGVRSDNVSYEVRTAAGGQSVLTIIADSEWINDEARELPVTIDPQVVAAGSSGMSTYGWMNGTMTSASESISVGSVQQGSSCFASRMYMKLKAPQIPGNPRIQKVTLELWQSGGVYRSGQRFCLYQVTGDIFTGTCTPTIKANMLDYVNCVNGSAAYSFDITAAYDSMLRGEAAYANLMLRAEDESGSTTAYASIYGTGGGNYAPKITVTYENGYTVNAGTGVTHDLGALGTGSVDLQSGVLSVEWEDMAWQGNRMPVSIRHAFTGALAGRQYTANSSIDLNIANFSAMQLGYGWKLNYMQSMVEKTLQSEGTSRNGRVYTNASGEQIHLIESTKEYFKRETDTEEYYLYEDMNDMGYLYDPVKRELYHCAETYVFDTAGRLTELRDQNENRAELVYTSGRLTSIVDGAGRVFQLSYNGSTGGLTSITAPDGTEVTYQYTGGNLTGVTARDGTYTKLEYTLNRLTAVSTYATSTSTSYEYRVSYTYDSAGRIQRIQEIGKGGAIGQAATFAYSNVGRKTTVNTATNNSDTTEDHTTVYTFDHEGKITGSYAQTDDGENMQIFTSKSGINPYVGGVGYRNNVDNLLTNPSFETTSGTTGWTTVRGTTAALTTTYVTNKQENALYGRSYFSILEPIPNEGVEGVYQQVNALPAGEYAFSVYIKSLTEVTSTLANPGVYLRVTNTSNVEIARGERLTSTDGEYLRFVLPFTLTETQTVRVWICINGKATLHVDAAQLEKNLFAGAYNCLTNGSFEQSQAGWTTTSGVSTSTTEKFYGSRSLFITGSLSSARSASQTVAVKGFTNVREGFTLSGYAKAPSVPTKDRTGNKARFRLVAKIKYTDNTTEEHAADFSPTTDEWQFAYVRFAKTKFKAIQSLTVACDYSYNSGTAWFDCIQLARDNYETGLTKYAFPGEYDTDETADLDPTPAPKTTGFEEARDQHGNIITETTFVSGKTGTLFRSFGYNEDDGTVVGGNGGNDLIRVTDERGYKTKYTVDSRTSRIQTIEDRCGSKTEFTYDNNGKLKLITTKNSTGTTLSTANYTYNSFGQLTKTLRGDNASFTYTYNNYRRLASVQSSSTGSLTSYTYNAGNSRLKTVTMKDGTVTYAYNRFGQILSETWKKGGITTHRYKYGYDRNGQIVRVIDILNQKEYNTYYKKGSIVSHVTVNDVVLNSSEIVTSKTLSSIVFYRYNDSNTLVGKRIVSGSKEQNYTYAYAGDGSLIVTMPGGAVSQSDTDHLGRKTADELTIAGSFLTRGYTYHAGEATVEHKAHGKFRYGATTRLVDTLTLAGGNWSRTLGYIYDGEQRVTKVTDSDGDVIQYGYDALGRLTNETKGGLTSTVSYDAYGNILNKGGKAYSYSSTHRDRLTGYNGQAISYGDSPNPITYRGWSFTWNKGWQLAKAVNGSKTIEFTYSPSGIRTIKKIGNVTYRYTIDGTKLLRDETNNIDYLYDNENKVCGMVYLTQAYYFVRNLQNDVIAITDTEGKVIAKYSYDAWGKCTVTGLTTLGNTVAGKNLFRYRSYIFDTDLGLYYLQNRYYDPDTGRFISEDPAKDGSNWYAYCNGDPVNHVDPTGLWVQVDTTLWEAQKDDTLSSLAYKVWGNGSLWTEFGFQGDPSRDLYVGDIIDITGWGKVGHNYGSYVEYIGGGSLIGGTRMPTYTYNKPAVTKPSTSTGSGTISSTSAPGKGESSGGSSSGGTGKFTIIHTSSGDDKKNIARYDGGYSSIIANEGLSGGIFDAKSNRVPGYGDVSANGITHTISLTEDNSDLWNWNTRFPYAYNWKGHAISKYFLELVALLGISLKVNPDYLMAVMAFESWLDPAAVNPATGATGLIQFMPDTAKFLGTTTDALKNMWATEQLVYVEKYFAPYKGKMNTLSDVYMAVLWPAAVGESDAYVLWEKGGKYDLQYKQNSGLDINKDGKITKGEAAAMVYERMNTFQFVKTVTWTFY